MVVLYNLLVLVFYGRVFGLLSKAEQFFFHAFDGENRAGCGEVEMVCHVKGASFLPSTEYTIFEQVLFLVNHLAEPFRRQFIQHGVEVVIHGCIFCNRAG